MCRSTLPVATLLWYASAHVDAVLCAFAVLRILIMSVGFTYSWRDCWGTQRRATIITFAPCDWVESQAYPEEPRIAVEQAVASAMKLAADTEKLPLDDQTCVRDYSKACPVGARVL